MKIVTKAFLILAIVGWQNSIQAQNSVGGRVGINLAKVDGEGMDTDAKVGLDIAVSADIGVSETFSIQPELHFLQKGYKFNFLGSDLKRALNYLEIPVLIKYNLGTQESIAGFILAGPSIGFGIGYKAKSDGDEDTGSFDDIGLKSTDFSINFGGGVSIPITGGKVVIDARYLLGLANIADGEGEIRNRGINLGVSYLTFFGE